MDVRRTTHQVLYVIKNVATPVVANVVQYDDNWTFLQNGATKLPPCSLLRFAAAQYEISAEVTATGVSASSIYINAQ